MQWNAKRKRGRKDFPGKEYCLQKLGKVQKKWWTEKAHIFLTGKLEGVQLYNLFMTHQYVSTTAKDRMNENAKHM